MDDLECFCRTRCIGCSAEVALKFFELNAPNSGEIPQPTGPSQSVPHVIFLAGSPAQAARFIAVVSIIPNHLLVLAGDMRR
jgi:hypothetical protein